MRIFEITLPRKKLDEIDFGAVKAPAARGAAVAGGFASALGKAITNAPLKALGAKTGADLVPNPDDAKDRASIAARMDAATKAAMPVITQQADQQQKMWAASVADMMKKGGVTTMAELDPAQLREPLMKQIETLGKPYGLSNYKNLPNAVDPESFGGAGKEEAMNTVEAIDAAIATVLDPKQQAGAQARNNWINLCKEIYAAGQQAQFREKSYASGHDLAAPEAVDELTQRLDTAGLTANKLRLPPNVVRPTSDPRINGFLSALGLIPRAVTPTPAPKTTPVTAPAPVTAEAVGTGINVAALAQKAATAKLTAQALNLPSGKVALTNDPNINALLQAVGLVPMQAGAK